MQINRKMLRDHIDLGNIKASPSLMRGRGGGIKASRRSVVDDG